MAYTILLVDDESAVREGIRNRTPWERYNFKVVGEAGNGIEALEMIEELRPDVVITDISRNSLTKCFKRAAPVGVQSSPCTWVLYTGIPCKIWAVAGAGTGRIPWAQWTWPLPTWTGEAMI